MKCRHCLFDRVVNVSGKTGDYVTVSINDSEIQGDGVPRDMNIGGGDYLEFSYCLECGRIQNTFPLQITELEDLYTTNG